MEYCKGLHSESVLLTQPDIIWVKSIINKPVVEGIAAAVDVTTSDVKSGVMFVGEDRAGVCAFGVWSVVDKAWYNPVYRNELDELAVLILFFFIKN
jgi:hypothetical protein